MNLAKFSVTRPVAVTMRIAALVLLGFVCFYKLPVDLLPAVSQPTVAVITQWPNVAPEELETQITRPIEQAVNSAPNIYQVSSSTVTGVSTVRVQFNWGTDIGQGAVDVLQLVERARQRFPTDPTLQTPIVYKYDPSQLPIMIYGVSGESDPVKLRTLLDNTISPIISSANGVASAVATGGEQRALIIDVDPDKLRAYHLTLTQVSNRIIAEKITCRRESPKKATRSTPSGRKASSSTRRMPPTFPSACTTGRLCLSARSPTFRTAIRKRACIRA